MRLNELFDEGMSITNSLQQAAIDILTPLLASKVPYVTVQSIIDALREKHTGLYVDRALIMKILDPEQVKSISKIEGDRIYLQSPDEDFVKSTEDEKENEIDKIKNQARKQAQNDIKTDNKPVTPPPPPPPPPPLKK